MSNTDSELVEYLFVDTTRLDSYLEQCAGPTVYDKVPVWTVEGSILGPKATTQQARVPRMRTLHEKVTLLRQHLAERGLVSSERPKSYMGSFADGEYRQRPVFCAETILARRVSIPSRQSEERKSGFALWASVEKEDANRHSLILIEDCPLSDEHSIQGCGVSHFSALIYLIAEMREQLSSTSLIVPNSVMETKDIYSWLDDPDFLLTSIAGSVSGRELVDDSPIRLLRRLGCRVGDERLIKVLYRIRTLSDAGHGVFGYPIIVAEASAEEKAKHEASTRELADKLDVEVKRMRRRFNKYEGD